MPPFKKGKNKVSKTELMKPFARGGNNLDLLNQEIPSRVGKQFFENSKAKKQTENKQDENKPRENKQDGKEQDESKNPPAEKKRRNNRKERKPIESIKSGVEQRGKAPDAHGFNCPVCDKSFRLESALGQHRTMKHAYTENVAEQAKVTAEVPTQPEVASTLPDMKKGKENGPAAKTKAAATQRDAGEAAGETALYCEPCNRSFGSKFALNAHQRTKHGPQNNGNRSAKRNYHCDMCENKPRRGFYNQHALEKHQHQKHDVPMPVRPWPCESCDRSFDTDSQLAHHERSQHRVFRQKEVLSAESTSSGVPKEEKTEDTVEEKVTETQQVAREPAKDDPLRCRACNKTFGNTRGFDEHQRTRHNKKATKRNEKPANRDYGMSCDICGQKSFLTQDALDQHQRQKHDKDIPTDRPKREDKRDMQKPTYKVSCIGKKFDCEQRFTKFSHMMLHVEIDNCDSFLGGTEIWEMFRDGMSPDACRFFHSTGGKEYFKCPECKGSKFQNLNSLILHAEGDSCSMNPSSGPLHKTIQEIPGVAQFIYYDSFYNALKGSEEKDEEDEEDEMDAFYRNEDPWENGFQGHPHFQEDYDIALLEKHGYY